MNDVSEAARPNARRTRSRRGRDRGEQPRRSQPVSGPRAMTLLSVPVVVSNRAMSGPPMAVFESDEELVDAVRQGQASLELEGLRATPDAEAFLVEALRSGMSEDDYFRAIYARRFKKKPQER